MAVKDTILSVPRQALLDPIREADPANRYRRVWSALTVEVVILFGAAGLVFILVDILRVAPPTALVPVLSVGMVVLPLLLWLLLSVLAERRAIEPRQRLIVVFVITALAANAITLPFIEGVLQPGRWLPLEDAINRIIGYTFSIGIMQETTKYLVLRYTIWQDLLRIRTDAVAYSVASALGYAFALNIQFLIANPGASLDVVALRVVENVALNLVGALFISLGLAETRFSTPSPFFMTIMLALAAFVVGTTQPLQSGLVNAIFSVRGVFDRPLVGFGFTAALFFGVLAMVTFLYSAIERRERDLAKTKDGR